MCDLCGAAAARRYKMTNGPSAVMTCLESAEPRRQSGSSGSKLRVPVPSCQTQQLHRAVPWVPREKRHVCLDCRACKCVTGSLRSQSANAGGVLQAGEG